MEDMFTGKVSNPYIAQNKEGTEVDPSSLFSSYISLVKIKMERSDEALIRKHFTIHEDVLKFGQSVFEHSLKLQKTAAYYIRKYILPYSGRPLPIQI